MVIAAPIPPVVVDDPLGNLLVEYFMSEGDRSGLAKELIAAISDTFCADISVNDEDTPGLA